MDLTGKTIASVTTRLMAARDTFGDWTDWEETTLHFTDGTTHSFAVDNTDVYAPVREQLDCEHCDSPIVEHPDPDRAGTYVHPFDTFDADHEPTPAHRTEGDDPDALTSDEELMFERRVLAEGR